MPDPVTGTIAGVGLIGAGAGAWGAYEAGEAQRDAAKEAADVQWKMYQQSRENLAPWREAGTRAVGTLEGLIGAGPGDFKESPSFGHFQNFSYGVSALVLLVGCLMVFVTMMGSVRELTVEIGIFRAMGFRKSHVIRIVLLEATIIAAAAGILGYFAGLGATRALLPLFTEGHGHGAVSLDTLMAGSAFLASIILGISASLYPALMASRLDPNEALRAL